MEQKFKKTPAGKIPVDWEVVKLGDKISLEYGEGLIESKRKYGKYPVYGSNGIIGYHDNFLIKGPGLVVGRKGTIGAVNWSDIDFWPIDTTYYIKLLDTNLNLRWLYYKLKSLNLSKLNMATGTPGLNRDIACSQIIPLPPPTEQRKIGEILSAVDNAIDKTDAVIEKIKELKKGLMQTLLTKGIQKGKFKTRDFKDTEIGRIPKEWEVVALSKIGDIATGTTPSTKVKEFWGDGYPFVTPTDFSESKYVYNTARAVTQSGANKGRIIPKNSIMVVCIASVGKVSMASSDCITNQQINSIICNDTINPHYVYYVISFRSNLLKSLAGSSAVPIIKKSLFEQIKLPLPSLPEQKEIAEVLSTVDDEISHEEVHKYQLEQMKQALMHVLLTGKVRV
jgi:type I restriction enzyme S subunit